MIRGRYPADGGGHNPSPRRAGCEQHLSGSVRGAPGDRGAYSIALRAGYAGGKVGRVATPTPLSGLRSGSQADSLFGAFA